jgi:glucose/arabinose dehydrogenase/mono/diheme cytochrome c family protein
LGFEASQLLAVGVLMAQCLLGLGAVTAEKDEAASPAVELEARLPRGRELYLKNCFVCHQINGQGTPGVFPPLAKSDYLLADREGAIRALCEGLSREIVVNGRRYAGAMPPALLDDAEVADVLTYVLNSWDNAGGVVTSNEVKTVRAKTAFPTLERLQKASVYPSLPSPPDGFTLREVVRLPQKGVRLSSDGEGKVLYVLSETGDVWRLDPANGAIRQVLWAKRYLEKRPGDIGGPLFVLGLTMDKQKRLYIASNQQNKSTLPAQNIVTIYRTTSFLDGDPVDPKPWFQTNYPGNAAYIHGVEHIAFGPDGFLYVGNGARTDAGQTGTDTTWFGGAETPITSSIWRLAADEEPPTLEIFARGIRNAYGFCWNDKGEMFATENGPDADAPEELNLIERGRHYGFPYKFSNWTKKAYSHTPDPPPGLEFALPIPNLGPDGGYNGTPLYSFDPHSGPGGIVFLGEDFPEGYRGTFLLTRFGNFIRTPKDNVGFDLLQAKLSKNANGQYEARIYMVLAPLGRPIDVHLSGQGKVYICEYSRPTNSRGSYSLPGRILELKVNGK